MLSRFGVVIAKSSDWKQGGLDLNLAVELDAEAIT